MPKVTIQSKKIKGELKAPSDKSISHRAVILGSLAQGKTKILNFSPCDDCLSTLGAFKELGVSMVHQEDELIIEGRGLGGLQKPRGRIYLGNSGTSMRLILGVLSGEDFPVTLTGDASLSRRPMKRITAPLSSMGAKIEGGDDANFAPLTIQGGKLKAIDYVTPMASAQVKSAILLAGLYAEGATTVRFSAASRDHTERMLMQFGVSLSLDSNSVSVQGRACLKAQDIVIPGDISAAAFFLVAASIVPGSEVTVHSVGLNPTRVACVAVLRQMGASVDVRYADKKMKNASYSGEACGDITVHYGSLKGIVIEAKSIPLVIDELPILMVAATQAHGKTIIKGAGELRVKETDRISAMVANLSKMGASISSSGDDVVINGPSKLEANKVESFGDHRIAMSMAIAGLVARGDTTIANSECVDISFPGFFNELMRLAG